ncbi:MAG: tetratricopeptide repeat protein [Gammaproteobacteria bacterium]|nr:tetratricopeptide repeat protein [Gammaproteobacteria bacterium]
MEQAEYSTSVRWCERALDSFQRSDDQHGIATTRHVLGLAQQYMGNVAAAQECYRMALLINEAIGNAYGATLNHAQLGIIEAALGNAMEATRCLLRAIAGFRASKQAHWSAETEKHLRALHDRCSPADQSTVRAMWLEANLGRFPDSSQ